MNNKPSYKISDSLVQFLVENTNGFISADILEKIFSAIEIEVSNFHFTSASEANLIRIISAVFNSKSFLRELLKYPHHLEITIAIAASSNYLTDIVVRNPEYLYQLFNQHYLKSKISAAGLSKEIAEIQMRFKTFKSKTNILRNLKSKSMLAIGLRDILGFSEFEETVQQISITASEILSAHFENCYRNVLDKYNIKSTRRKYCLASLGKLGGCELNYSSDVDLILFFDRNSKIGSSAKTEYYQVLDDTVKLFISSASELTASGYLFRTDFRLRPDGKNAPLCRTVADYEMYYEIRGEDWERQMLIKLNFISGSKTLFNSFKNYIVHFVYPASFSISPLAQIKKMKRNIEKRLHKEFNIKLFKGGIRDIEFAVQALQLLNGGKKSELRTGNTLKAIDNLLKYNFLNKDEAYKFRQAYIFYRKIEHFLQLLNDTQTHSIPENKNTKLMLIKYLAISSSLEFDRELDIHRKSVRKIFEEITGSNTDLNFHRKFNFEIFNNKQRAKANYLFLSIGKELTGQSKFDSRTSELFYEILPALQTNIQHSNQPDRVFENFTKFIKSVSVISIWYRELADTKHLNNLLLLCEYSSYAIELICIQRNLSELILSGKVFSKNIEQIFSGINGDEVLLILSIQFTLGLINSAKLSSILFKYLKFIISKEADKMKLNTNYFIAALGSFGSKSMSLKSDIDLIFVVENLDEYETIQKEFQKLLKSIKDSLPMFEVDCRLRPEGSKSPLVWDLKSYKDYLKKRARVWEFQSLMKSNYLSGSTKIFNQFKNNILVQLKSINIITVKNEMMTMIKSLRSKNNSIFFGTIDIKNGWGSLTYINFIISFKLFSNPKALEKLWGKSLLEKIKYFSEYDSEKELFIQLKENYKFLKNIELLLQNCLNKRNSVIPKEGNDLQLITAFLGFENEEQFLKQIGKVSKLNNKIFERVLDE